MGRKTVVINKKEADSIKKLDKKKLAQYRRATFMLPEDGMHIAPKNNFVKTNDSFFDAESGKVPQTDMANEVVPEEDFYSNDTDAAEVKDKIKEKHNKYDLNKAPFSNDKHRFQFY